MAADCVVWKLEVYGCKTWISIENLKVVQGKGKRPLRSTFGTLDSGTQKIHRSRKTSRLSFNGQPLPTGAGGDFDNRYSQRGVQWAVKQVAKAAGIIKEVHTTTALLCHICWKTAWIS
jgi:hypothetical protein